MSEQRPMAKFLDGVIRGLGLSTPGLFLAMLMLYRDQDFSIRDHLLLWSVVGLLFFVIVGYSIFHKSLYGRFGRAALFLFITWAFIVGLSRVGSILSWLSQDEVRAVNTLAAVAFAVVLSYMAWWKPLALSIFNYLFVNGRSASD